MIWRLSAHFLIYSRFRLGIVIGQGSERFPEKTLTTSYIAGSNLAIASACCRYGERRRIHTHSSTGAA